MKIYNKPSFKITEIYDIISASGRGEDLLKGIANPEMSGTIDFNDSILDPVPNAGEKLKSLFPAN